MSPVAVGAIEAVAIVGTDLKVPLLVVAMSALVLAVVALAVTGIRRSIRDAQVGIDRITLWGWLPLGAALAWAIFSIARLSTMTIEQIAGTTDPLAGFDPIPDAGLTMFQRDGLLAYLWLGLPLAAVLLVAVCRRRSVARAAGGVLVLTSIATHVVAIEAFPVAALVFLAGYIGPRPDRVPARAAPLPPPPDDPTGPTLGNHA